MKLSDNEHDSESLIELFSITKNKSVKIPPIWELLIWNDYQKSLSDNFIC